MKAVFVFAILLTLTACNSRYNEKNQSRHARSYTWIIGNGVNHQSVQYKPGNISVSWYFGDCNKSDTAKSGIPEAYSNSGSGVISQGPGLGNSFYNAGYSVTNNISVLTEIAVNEKEMVIKLKTGEQSEDTVCVIFKLSIPDSTETFLEKTSGIIIADETAEKLFFHHYGKVPECNASGSDSSSLTLSLADSVYFYSGDERSPMYLEEMINRKRIEFEAQNDHDFK